MGSSSERDKVLRTHPTTRAGARANTPFLLCHSFVRNSLITFDKFCPSTRLTRSRGGDLMRFYTKQHQFYCGIDLHARTMYLCILNQEGEILVHRNMPAGPDPFLKTIAPYRENLVVCVECIFTWDWLADLCAREGIPFVLGHALYMKAIHGGKAKNDQIDAQKIAVLLRGGMLPQAYVYPAELRATRDLLSRRLHSSLHSARLLTHVQQTN